VLMFKPNTARRFISLVTLKGKSGLIDVVILTVEPIGAFAILRILPTPILFLSGTDNCLCKAPRLNLIALPPRTIVDVKAFTIFYKIRL